MSVQSISLTRLFQQPEVDPIIKVRKLSGIGDSFLCYSQVVLNLPPESRGCGQVADRDGRIPPSAAGEHPGVSYS